MLTKAVIGEENLILGAVGEGGVRPMKQGNRDELQRPLANLERVLVVDNEPRCLLHAIKNLQVFLALLCTDKRRVCELMVVVFKRGRVVAFSMIHDDVLDLVERAACRNTREPFLGEGVLTESITVGHSSSMKYELYELPSSVWYP